MPTRRSPSASTIWRWCRSPMPRMSASPAGVGNFQAIYGSTFFMATGFHGFHVIIGTIFLAVCLFRAIAGQFTPDAPFRLRSGGLVLALRRRGVAVPVLLHLCLGRRPRHGRLAFWPLSSSRLRSWAFRPHRSALLLRMPKCCALFQRDPAQYLQGDLPRPLSAMRAGAVVQRLSGAAQPVPRLRAGLRHVRCRRRPGGVRHPDRGRHCLRPGAVGGVHLLAAAVGPCRCCGFP